MTKTVEARIAQRLKSIFTSFGSVINDFYLEAGIYFVGGLNASLIAWGIYNALLDTGEPLAFAIVVGIIAFIAVEGLAVFLVTAAAKTKSTWLWFFSILFAAFFTFAHMQEANRPGVIVQYITQAIPFFIVIGYWARTVKIEADATAQRLQHIEEDDRQRELRIADEKRARKQQIEDEERHHKQQMAIDTKEKSFKLKMSKLQNPGVKPDDVNIMSKGSQSHVKHEVIDINLGKTNDQKRLSKIENLDKLRHLLKEDPNLSVIKIATILKVNRQTVYNYKQEIQALKADSNGEAK